nr:MAG TPA: hypothetical protein [Caudoviricetes sp.]
MTTYRKPFTRHKPMCSVPLRVCDKVGNPW